MMTRALLSHLRTALHSLQCAQGVVILALVMTVLVNHGAPRALFEST